MKSSTFSAEPVTNVIIGIGIFFGYLIAWHYIVEKINEEWPPLTLLDQRGHSVEENSKTLSEFEPNAYFSFRSDFVEDALLAAFAAARDKIAEEGVVLEEPQRALEQPVHRADAAAVRTLARRRSKERTEQLVGAVEQVKSHGKRVLGAGNWALDGETPRCAFCPAPSSRFPVPRSAKQTSRE